MPEQTSQIILLAAPSGVAVLAAVLTSISAKGWTVAAPCLAVAGAGEAVISLLATVSDQAGLAGRATVTPTVAVVRVVVAQAQTVLPGRLLLTVRGAVVAVVQRAAVAAMLLGPVVLVPNPEAVEAVEALRATGLILVLAATAALAWSASTLGEVHDEIR